MNSGARIHAENLSKVFSTEKHTTTAFEDLNFEVRAGEFVCLLGPSGCGKSTILSIMNGLEKPSTGKLKIDSNQQSLEDIKVGMVFQENGLFPWMNLQQNIKFILDSQPYLKTQDTEALSIHHLTQVGLAKFLQHYPHQLSGGMRQRASIARSFAIDPDLLLMDEPFVFLDYQTRLQIQQMLMKLWQDANKTVVFVTHDIEEAVLLADRIIVLTAHPGRIKATLTVDLPRPRDFFALKKNDRFHELVQHASSLIQEELSELGGQG